MNYPKLNETRSSRQTLDVFRGYHHGSRIGDTEFYDMKNLTSDDYPVLSSRKKRGIYADIPAPNGLIAKEQLCYVDGQDFVLGDTRVAMDLNPRPKQLVSMGAYVIILPDKKWINTLEPSQWGSVEAYFEAREDVTFTLCTPDGADFGQIHTGSASPENPQNLALWLDTAQTPHTLNRYSAASGTWVQVATTCVKIASPGIGAAFEKYDGVTISGIVSEKLQSLSGAAVILHREDDCIVVTGILDETVTQTPAQGTLRVERRMPEMDFVIESGNRLWGCRYGAGSDGAAVNEIYASKLGDFKNWSCFMGLSTDSYRASCGADGPFTGAITHLGYPLFFREHCIHKVYGSIPSNFQIQTTACRGVQQGCHKSLAIVNAMLYYKSQNAVCAYDGSLPVEISQALGDTAYDRAVAGAVGNKYYLSMRDVQADADCLFVYDTAKGLWHKEDDFRAEDFCGFRGELYGISRGKIHAMLGTAGQQEEAPVSWMAETGPMGLETPDMKYISRITLRLSMESGALVRVLARYDREGDWELLFCVRCTRLRSFSLPIRPRRCDHLRLRIEGEGGVKLYAITKTMEKGSELP